MSPLALGLLAVAIVAAFVKSLYEQRLRQLVRARDVEDGSALGAPGRARRVQDKARLWRVVFYLAALGALGVTIAGW